LSPEWEMKANGEHDPDWRYDNDEAIDIAKYAVHELLELYSPVVKELSGMDLNVTSVQTNRWPLSVHIARPGHFATKAAILREPVGHIFFGNNNMGTPAFEEALFRGHCAADNILLRMDPKFKETMATEESWTLCPIEK
jgi:hypothetical protein